jgi:hypothetical protein
MPKGNEWVYFIYVNIGFIILNLAIVYFGSVAEIKKNWPLYRCNPMYMWLSDDMSEDFTGCVQTMQSDFMPDLLSPLNYIVSELSSMGLGFVNEIQSVRNMFDYIRTQVTGIFNQIFGIFINLIIEFTKIGISLKDMMDKQLGIVTVMLYIIEGTGTSVQQGMNTFEPITSIMSCFHPNTIVKLKNGQIYPMKNIPLGSILENGARVQVVLNLEKTEPLYLIKNAGVNNTDIYVSGSHFILYNDKYILVKDYPFAISQTKVQSDIYTSLITSDHTIQIGKITFWDWEDDDLYK